MAVMPKPDDRASYQLVEAEIVGQMMQTDHQWGLYDLDRNAVGRPLRHDASRSLRDLR